MEYRCVLTCDLNVPMLPELRMAGISPFQTVDAAEGKSCAAVLASDIGTVSKSISADLSPQRGTYGSKCSAADSLVD